MFITIDGPDGVGKTTVAKKLVEKLIRHSLDACYTCEPTHSAQGAKIREILKGGSVEQAACLTQLFLQDRCAHIKELQPRLNDPSYYIVCDRYRYSTVSYQHLHGSETIEQLVQLNAGFPSPHWAFILTVDDVELLLRRITHRNEAVELFEQRAHLNQIIDVYKNMKKYYPQDNIIEIPVYGDSTPDAVVDKMWESING